MAADLEKLYRERLKALTADEPLSIEILGRAFRGEFQQFIIGLPRKTVVGQVEGRQRINNTAEHEVSTEEMENCSALCEKLCALCVRYSTLLILYFYLYHYPEDYFLDNDSTTGVDSRRVRGERVVVPRIVFPLAECLTSTLYGPHINHLDRSQ